MKRLATTILALCISSTGFSLTCRNELGDGAKEFTTSMSSELDPENLGLIHLGLYSTSLIKNDLILTFNKLERNNSWVWMKNGISVFAILDQMDFTRTSKINITIKDYIQGLIEEVELTCDSKALSQNVTVSSISEENVDKLEELRDLELPIEILIAKVEKIVGADSYLSELTDQQKYDFIQAIFSWQNVDKTVLEVLESIV